MQGDQSTTGIKNFIFFKSCRTNSLEFSRISTDEWILTFEKILKELIAEESRLNLSTNNQHEACTTGQEH
ncbi:hypothetical protein TNCV_3074201 [Trichonephila clavipes]|uniref:Uncharacterized protein n=1 Tax=Trichonephila clavipes TaxID=2585209 RepID=A0A8X6VN57_TRICX|nr:hypothetical protein TNCV_3074201 [Trichonephila clavipes]